MSFAFVQCSLVVYTKNDARKLFSFIFRYRSIVRGKSSIVEANGPGGKTSRGSTGKVAKSPGVMKHRTSHTSPPK